ncbi:DUF1642 domain-containing protein [Ligilactobacillus murinus]|uniref:DUF1642 domain-containing protein n=1 Tax=Ligilactobacillus murinus TaxID=1622 RepID=UPI002DD649D8|nr:DUF1642 domain-containing protein [Ligilactobacillus murinus]WRY37100.1 hypothetical protein P8F80_08630 [Ligilactobacillus murinus]
MKKLVLTDGRYEFDNKTGNVSVTDDELRKLGYVKLAEDETVVKKVELSEEEAQFMESHKHLSFYEFSDSASIYVKSSARKPFGKCVVERRLNNAYFNGYKVRETKYYIKFNFSNNGFGYLNIRKDNGHWSVRGPVETSDIQTMFTQKEIKALQENEQAKGLDLNELKVNTSDIDITVKW